MAKAGRPKIQIDKAAFEKLCGLQCSLDEFAAFFECSPDTIERWCKATYDANFADVFAQKRGHGKIALRRAQFQLAQKSAAMAIFLGKNYLGQLDNPRESETNEITARLDAIAEALENAANETDA